ncbi:MAG TPA: hypothetical protein VII41_15210 [Steroidobacteraceae bacterium]
MLRVASRSARVAVALLVCACEAQSIKQGQPAVLTNPTAQSIAELNRVVREALHGAPIRLADDALTHDSVLIVEHRQPRDAAGLPLNGRELGRPEHFRLVMHHSRCILIHERAGESWALRSATCAPLADSRATGRRNSTGAQPPVVRR